MVSRDDLAELLRVDLEGWLAEVPLIAEHSDQFGSHLPSELRDEFQGMKERLEAAKKLKTRDGIPVLVVPARAKPEPPHFARLRLAARFACGSCGSPLRERGGFANDPG